MKSKRQRAALLAIATVYGAATLSAVPVEALTFNPKLNQQSASKKEPAGQAAQVEALTRGIKTKLPAGEGKKAAGYRREVDKSQTPRSLGKAALEPVVIPDTETPTASTAVNGAVNNSANNTVNNTVNAAGEQDELKSIEAKDNDKETVPLVRPPLKALISVQRNLSPLSLDAEFSQRVALEDVLTCAIAQNLGIENNIASLKIQKFGYLSEASHFLPDINGGYSLIGIHGSLPGALLGAPTSTSGASTSAKLPSHVQLLQAGFKYKAYQGGKVLFSTLQEKHKLQAAKASLKGTVNDVFLDVAKRYYDLVLNEALLEIRTRAVAISNEQVRLNTTQETAGTATGLDVLQSQAQLASDQQNLVDQQSARRQAAIKLSTAINASYFQDLVSSEDELKKRRLVPRAVPVKELIKIAIDNRPELKQYEELRLAAKRAIMVAGAPLQPTVALGGTVYGIGAGSGKLSSLGVLNFSVNWMLGSLGTTDLANIQQARWQARQAAIQAKQTFQTVFEQVHVSYDQSLAADSRIERASAQILAAEEELRIAKKRMHAGIGLNIDVLNAQRDLTQASINKAQAIVDFNIAQAQLLHDVGLISLDTLTQGARIQSQS